MGGIERIKIVGEKEWAGDYQAKSEAMMEAAGKLYPAMFAACGMPLIDCETKIVECTKDDVKSRYDWQEGVDVILHFKDGTRGTLQEKFLFYHVSTVTFETEKTSGAPGAWYYTTAQYYFFGYNKLYDVGGRTFTDWMLVDFPRLQRIDKRGGLPWVKRQNARFGRAAKFMYILFSQVPQDCVIARKRLQQPENVV
jgi:hypothetical protein